MRVDIAHVRRKLTIRLLATGLALALTTVPTASVAVPSDGETSVWNGLRPNMSAAETAAYLNSRGVRATESLQDGVAIVVPKDRERFAGMKGDVQLGFSRKGLQFVDFTFHGPGFDDYATIVARLAALYGPPVGEFAPRLHHGPIGSSAFAQTFFGGPPRSVSLFYTSYCSSPRRHPNDKSITIRVDLRRIVFPPQRVRVTGDSDGWCRAG